MNFIKLKILLKFAIPVDYGDKKAEIREYAKDGVAYRNFAIGDIVAFSVVCPKSWEVTSDGRLLDENKKDRLQEYTLISDSLGKKLFRITNVIFDTDFSAGIQKGYCVFSFEQISL